MGKQWARYPEMSGITDGKPVGSNGSKRAQNTKQKEESVVSCCVVRGGSERKQREDVRETQKCKELKEKRSRVNVRARTKKGFLFFL